MENSKSTALLEIKEQHICPECGAAMAEVERVSEKGYFYIWYGCRQPNCRGQWLEKKVLFQTWEWRNR